MKSTHRTVTIKIYEEIFSSEKTCPNTRERAEEVSFTGKNKTISEEYILMPIYFEVRRIYVIFQIK